MDSKVAKEFMEGNLLKYLKVQPCGVLIYFQVFSERFRSFRGFHRSFRSLRCISERIKMFQGVSGFRRTLAFGEVSREFQGRFSGRDIRWLHKFSHELQGVS